MHKLIFYCAYPLVKIDAESNARVRTSASPHKLAPATLQIRRFIVQAASLPGGSHLLSTGISLGIALYIAETSTLQHDIAGKEMAFERGYVELACHDTHQLT